MKNELQDASDVNNDGEIGNNDVDSNENSISSDLEIILSIVANLRLWIGDSSNAVFEDQKDDLQIKREISDRLVQVGKSFENF